MEKLKYFVYTSGEMHGGQVDWGAKFASDDFPLPNGSEIHDGDSHENLIDLGNTYTENVMRFGLSGGLTEHRPSGDGLGYIVLPWNEKYTLVGIYANFIDLKKRANIGLVMVAVPRDVQKSMSPQGVISALLKDNDIMGIAEPRLNKEESKVSSRPKRLLLDDSGTTKDIDSSLEVLEGVGWPTRKNAFILIDGQIQKFTGSELKAESKSATTGKTRVQHTPQKRKSVMVFFVAGILVLVLIIGVMSTLKNSVPSLLPEPGKSTNHVEESANHVEESANQVGELVTQPEESMKQPEELMKQPEESMTQLEESMTQPEGSVSQFEELAQSIISRGISKNTPVVGLATVSKVGGNNYKIESITGEVPLNVGDEFVVKAPSAIRRPESSDYIVSTDKVRKKLTDWLHKLEYSGEPDDRVPTYYVTKTEWEQAQADIKSLFRESGEISKSTVGLIPPESLQSKITETLEEGEVSHIVFFERYDGIWQNLRIISMDKDKNFNVDLRIVEVGENIALNSTKYKRWFDRFKSGDPAPAAPGLQFYDIKKGLLLLHGKGLKNERGAYKQFADQMIEVLKN